MRNIRFWIFLNNGWVKVKLKPGQTVAHSSGSPTEEGYRSEINEFAYHNHLVFWTIRESQRDCDGRLDTVTKMVTRVEFLKNMRCCVGQDKNGDDILSDSMFRPWWEKIESYQRDYTAESMGY